MKQSAARRRPLPPFTSRGTLPAGVHVSTWGEFIKRFSHNPQRRKLMKGLRRAITILRKAGCTTIFIGGSYVTDEEMPFDIDVVWKSEEVRWRYLEWIAPVFFEMTPGNPWQKAIFSGEFFPSEGVETETGRIFFEFFQYGRDKRRRGIVQLDIMRIGKRRRGR